MDGFRPSLALSLIATIAGAVAGLVAGFFVGFLVFGRLLDSGGLLDPFLTGLFSAGLGAPVGAVMAFAWFVREVRQQQRSSVSSNA